MPQNGFHGLAGLGIARLIGRRAPRDARPVLAPAVVLGAMLPDIDMYPTAVAFLMGRKDLIYVIHRSATHSLALCAALALACIFFRARPVVSWTLFGLAIGVLSHITLDLLFWFAPLDLFWPLSHVPQDSGILPVANLWSSISVPAILVNVREAFEFAAFALFLYALRRLSKNEQMRRWEIFGWFMFDISLITAYYFQENPSLQNYVVTTPYLLLFLPLCWSQIVKLRTDIANWAGGAPPEAESA